MNLQTTFKRIAFNLCLVGLAAGLLSGCASTKVSNREQLVNGPLPRPATIWVYDFVATPDDVPANSALAGEKDVDTTSQTAAEIAEGKKLGNLIATELVAQIRAAGMTAELGSPTTKPQVNDIMIHGYLLSVNAGSAAKRVTIGFGSGASELRTMVEGYQMTAKGERKLGSGTVEAAGGKSPGGILGVATFLATKNPAGLIISGGMHIYGEASGSSELSGRAKAIVKEIADGLKKRFQAQGWIK
ncbi:MAG: DUF4410 domain-containing protein [Verrucomicrobiota bacterium]